MTSRFCSVERASRSAEARRANRLANPAISGEAWRPISGLERDYEISSIGRVRRASSGNGTWPGRIFSPHPDVSGYLTVVLKGKTCRVHHMVASAFLGPRPTGMQVNHIDGNKENNTLENLEYVTPARNVQHSHDIGLHPEPRGQEHGQALLTEADVMGIRTMLHSGSTQREVAGAYGVSQATVGHIHTRRTWAWLEES
jgi:hypothetical protein